MKKVGICFVFICLFCSEVCSQESKKLQYIISSQLSYISTIGHNEHIEFENSIWINIDGAISFKLNNDEIQLGVSYNTYKRTLYDYRIEFGCDFLPNGKVNHKASGVNYVNNRNFVGIPLNYIFSINKVKNNIGLLIGFEPRFLYEESGTPKIFECGIFDSTRPPIDYPIESIGNMYFAKIGIMYTVSIGRHFKMIVEPIVEILLNEEKYRGIPTYSTLEPITNRIINTGIKLGIKL